MFQELGFRLLEHLLVSIDLSCMNKILYILFVCTVLPLFSKAQGYTMDLPRLKTFPPYQIDREKRSFVVSWEARDNSVARCVIAYVGVERTVEQDGVQNVLETTLKGDTTLSGNACKSLGINAFVHDYMTGQGWYMRMGQVSAKGLVFKPDASLPQDWTPVLMSPVFDASRDGGKFTIRFTATVVDCKPGESVTLVVRHWADRRGTAMEEKVVELIADGKAHEYLVECSRGMNNENVSIQAGVTGSTVLLSGDIEIEQRLEKGDRVWHSVALTQMNRPAGADFTKINELGIKVDTMEVTASFGASNVLDYKEHRRKGWRLFYTLFQMITAEDGVSTRASLYSDPVYFEE